MNHRSTVRRRTLITVTAVLSLLVTTGLGSSVAAAAPDPAPAPAPADPVVIPTPGHQPLAAGATDKMSADLLTVGDGTQDVFVQLALAGAADAAAGAQATGGDPKASAADQKAAVAATVDAVVASAETVDAGAQQLFEVSNAVPGIGLRATKEALETLAARSDVVKISALVPKTLNNAGTAQLTQVLKTWQDTGVTGDGVSIGVIDTGIDYTHADFGGPGTPEAYQAAHEAETGPFTPTAKVVGGYDFVGDDYNADPDAETYQPEPHPDPNPLDCEGHGSHVAGTAAGYGVDHDGATFTGDYATLEGDDLYNMIIGPGMAPGASLYALRVFGCEGSTDVVIPALDWALDPNGDGDFTDHLDIVNLSLGSDLTPVDDPENAVIDNLAEHGVLSVLSAGNAGDLTDASGTPGNAVRGLGVASSVDEFQVVDALQVDAPEEVAGPVSGQASVAYPWTTSPDVSGSVVALSDPSNLDGCDPLSAADTEIVAGKVAWLEWDDTDARRCGSAGRANNVQKAGAIGAIFTSTLDVFEAGITGSAVIPVFQLTGGGTALLRTKLVDGTLVVTFRGDLLASFKEIKPQLTDTLSSFSSRGTHGSLGVVKPDVTAPGSTVFSVAVGTGAGGVSESGTSMASPLTAGVAALVLSVHPEWTPEQVKAAVMNTATHDVFTGLDRTGDRYGPARVGSGRLDALDAVTTTLLAYNADVDGAVSASFGVVEASIGRKTVYRSRTVLLQNTASTAADVTTSYDSAVSQPGVSYRVTPARVSVPAGGTATVRVVMKIVPSELRKTIDPTMQPLQLETLTGAELPRQFVSDASGWLVVAPAGAPSLRVPVYGAAKPTSATRARTVTNSAGSFISLRGKGFDQGDAADTFASLISVMDLGYTSPQLRSCSTTVTTDCTQNTSARSSDLHHVGANATLSPEGSTADGWLWFGLSTWVDWATVGHSAVPYVDIDTDADGVPDYQAQVQYSPDTDILMSFLIDLKAGTLIDVEPINFAYGDVDTNVFDSNTLLIPVWPALIGVTDDATTFPISYRVSIDSAYATSGDGVLDTTPSIAFDVVNPRIRVSSPLFSDQGGVGIPYSLGSSAVPTGGAQAASADVERRGASGGGATAFLIHLQGASKRHSELLRLR